MIIHDYYVYMLTDKNNTNLYIGVTNSLSRRLIEHQNSTPNHFTAKFHLKKLVYYEPHASPVTAIEREKQLKRWTRAKKDALITKMNPDWNDLSDRFPVQ